MNKQLTQLDLKIITECLSPSQRTYLNKVILLDSTTSTNDYLLEAIKNSTENKSGWLCLANQQTQGRGRQNKPWFSPPGNIYLSFTWRYQKNLEIPITTLSIIVAATLITVLSKIIPQYQLQFKWPNDILVNNRKLAGILLENIVTSNHHNIIIGIGVNINLPQEQQNIWAYLQEFQQNINRNLVIGKLLAELIESLLKFNTQNLIPHLQLIRKHDMLANKPILATAGGVELYGTAVSINDKGELLMIDQHSNHYNLSYGEVSILHQHIPV